MNTVLSAKPALNLSPMEHADYTFGLVSKTAKAAQWTSKALADRFASGIQDASVEPFALGRSVVYVVKVGPWMFARDLKARNA